VKILMISANVSSEPYAVYPLGMSMIAGALDRAGHDVHQYDFLQAGMSIDSVADVIRERTPELIGMSIRNIDSVNMLNEKKYVETAAQIVAKIREVTDVKIVIGGSAVSIMPETIMEVVQADYAIVGEGENLMVDFVTDAERGVYPKAPILRLPQMLRGDQFATPLYDPVLMDYYLQQGRIANVQTKRGCTFKCVYCNYPVLEGKTIRAQNAERVVDTVEMLVDRYEAKHIFFVDSVFNDSQGEYLELPKAMKRRGLSVPWTGFLKPEGLDEEGVALMAETGLAHAEIGADAATDITLKRLAKKYRYRDIVENNALLHRHGIHAAHFFMFGGPGETKETVREGIENIRRLENTVSFISMGLRIFPGTPLAKLADQHGLYARDYQSLDPIYYMAPGLDVDWLFEALTEGFKDLRHCVFPPHSLDRSLQFLYKRGHSGFLWELVIPGNERRRRRGRPRPRTEAVPPEPGFGAR
jgi:lipid biosynthesis B12-binding/radical SAM protein